VEDAISFRFQVETVRRKTSPGTASSCPTAALYSFAHEFPLERERTRERASLRGAERFPARLRNVAVPSGISDFALPAGGIALKHYERWSFEMAKGSA